MHSSSSRHGSRVPRVAEGAEWPNLADLQVGEMSTFSTITCVTPGIRGAVVLGAAQASSGRRSRATVRPSALEGQNRPRPRACALREERSAGAAPAPRAQHYM